MIHYLINVSVSHAAARIISISQTEIICGRFEELNLSTKLKQRSTQCDVTLKLYGLSAPEGLLAQVCALCHHFMSLSVCVFFMQASTFCLGVFFSVSGASIAEFF